MRKKNNDLHALDHAANKQEFNIYLNLSQLFNLLIAIVVQCDILANVYTDRNCTVMVHVLLMIKAAFRHLTF